VAVWAERLLFIMLPLLAIANPGICLPAEDLRLADSQQARRLVCELSRIERAASDGIRPRMSSASMRSTCGSTVSRCRRPTCHSFYTLRVHADYVRGLLVALREAKDPRAPAPLHHSARA